MKKYKKFIENVSNDKYLVDLSKLTIIDGKVKLWHYSPIKILDDHISISNPYNLNSVAEFKAWGRSRCFFYATEDGILYDKGVKSNYEYICYIDENKIYDLNRNSSITNPNINLEYSESTYENLYKSTLDDGFTAWTYNLDKNPNAPIVVSFENVKISESYMKTPSGQKVSFNWEPKDYIVGNFKIDNNIFDVYQKDGFIKHINNLYYIPELNNKNYKRPIYDYMLKDINFIDNYKNDYMK